MCASIDRSANCARGWMVPASPGARTESARPLPVALATSVRSLRFHDADALIAPPGWDACSPLTCTMRSARESSPDNDANARPLMVTSVPESRAVARRVGTVPRHSPNASSVPEGLHIREAWTPVERGRRCAPRRCRGRWRHATAGFPELQRDCRPTRPPTARRRVPAHRGRSRHARVGRSPR